jgi:hypothetical protein
MVRGDGVVIGSNFSLYEFGGLYFFLLGCQSPRDGQDW